jgi:hypothetical protein
MIKAELQEVAWDLEVVDPAPAVWLACSTNTELDMLEHLITNKEFMAKLRIILSEQEL